MVENEIVQLTEKFLRSKTGVETDVTMRYLGLVRSCRIDNNVQFMARALGSETL